MRPVFEEPAQIPAALKGLGFSRAAEAKQWDAALVDVGCFSGLYVFLTPFSKSLRTKLAKSDYFGLYSFHGR
jgi:hypothetical protein